MEIVFLGTGSMMPTKERAQTAIYLSYWNEHMLFDCGEGTQRQLRIAGISPAKINRIFLTHWHGDHFFGLPGLLENMSKHKMEKTIEIYGPKGTKLLVKKMADAFLLRYKIKINVHEINKNGVFLKDPRYIIRATYVKHGMPCIAYTFEEMPRRKIKTDYLKQKGIPEGPMLRQLQDGKDIIFRGRKITAREATYLQKGKKVAIILDTRIDKSCVNAAKNADLLICEATFNRALQKKAKEFYHMTADDAGKLAKKAKVNTLVLTHFSQRYNSIQELENEAKEHFKNVVMARDFMKLNV